MPNPFDEVLVEEAPVREEANPFDDVLKANNPFDEAVKEPDYPTLPEYLRFKVGMDTANTARSRWGSKAMWGQAKNEEALRMGEEEFNYHKAKAGDFRDLSFKEAPFKYVAGETAQLLPYMVSSLSEGLKDGIILGGGFAAITAVAGQAGPQAFLPEEVITVPAAFAGGMSTGFAYGVITNTLNREGGGMYLDLIQQGIRPEVARPVALASGTLIGIIEMAQFKLIGAPFRQALSKVIKTDIGKKALAGVLIRYANTVGGEIMEEELQEITQLVGETIAGIVDKSPNAVPTFDEWKTRLIQTAAKAGTGLAVISVPGAAVDYTSTVKSLKTVEKGVTQEQAELAEKEKPKLPLAKLPDEKGGAPLESLPEASKEAIEKARGLVQEKSKITPEKLKPDVSGVAPLQRQIQAMEERQARVETAQDALEEMNTVREYFKGRITKYEGAYLKEELQGIPKYYITKEGGLKPDEVMGELRDNFNIEIMNESELKEYLVSLEQSRKDLLVEIKSNRPELITKRETTLLNQRIKATEQGIKEGRMQTKEEIEAVQEELIQEIEEVDLSLSERAKFLRTIKNIQTRADLAREFPGVTERLQGMKEKQIKSELIGEIKKTAERAKDSQTIAVEYAELIRDAVDRFELQGHLPKTIGGLQKTKDFIKQAVKEGREIDMPQDILKKLEILERKPLKDITSQELEDLRDSVEEFEQLGKTKLRLRQMAYKRRKIRDLVKLKTESRPINLKEKIRGSLGENLNLMQSTQNWLISKANAKMEKSISLTPMDAVIDELDGEKNYKGANYTIFKKTIDTDWSEYNRLRHVFTDRAEKLAEGLNEGNFERIVAYATLQQEGGLDKLEALGYSKEEVGKIKLSPKEDALLKEMQKQFEASFPQISEVLRLNYNKPIKKVKFYFPFMTDFEAMTDFEIRDRFGDVPEYRKALRKNPEMGFAKERVGGKQKINLNALEVFTRHMDNVAYLLTVGKDIKYLNDLAATPEYGGAVGDLGQEIMREWLDLIARKGRMAGERIPFLDTLRRYAGGANLAFKLSSALIQPTSLFDGAALIGNYAFEGTQMITHKEIRQFLMDNFEEIKARAGDDPAYLDFYQKDNIIDKAIEKGLLPLQQLDKLTASSVTIGAYKKYCVDNGIEFDITKPNKEAIGYAQTILRRTQSSALFKDVPLALSKGKLSGNLSADKALLQFQSFLLNRWSLITHDLYKAGIKGANKKQAMNIAFWLIMATVAETLIRRGLRMAFEDEQKRDRGKTLGQDLALNAVQNIPFTGNMISLIFYGQAGIPAIDWVTGIGSSISSAIKSKGEEARNRNLLKAGVSALPGGAQIKQILPRKEEKGGLSRGKELKH